MKRNRTDKEVQEKFMRLALRLAQKAKGQTNPNPLVGAVIVKNGRLLSQGYHRKAGLAHAEVIALDKAGKAAYGATLYVTMEPCCHFGRTPPCVNKIIQSGIKKVVFAMADPNPLNNGKGACFLRRHRIKVVSGILREEARKINQVFIKYITQKLPFVTVKIAQSLDGKIATKDGQAHWISAQEAREFTHKLRSQVDAVLVGVNTVLRDNPCLSARLNGRLYKKQPKKVVVDSRLKLTPDLNIFSSRSPAPVIIATTRFAPQEKVLFFKKKTQVMLIKDKAKKVDLRVLLKKLAAQGIAHLLIEGGGEVVASALEEKLVDQLIVFIAPKIIGGRTAPTAVEGEGISRIKEAINLTEVRWSKVGPDLMISGRPR